MTDDKRREREKEREREREREENRAYLGGIRRVENIVKNERQ